MRFKSCFLGARWYAHHAYLASIWSLRSNPLNMRAGERRHASRTSLSLSLPGSLSLSLRGGSSPRLPWVFQTRRRWEGWDLVGALAPLVRRGLVALRVRLPVGVDGGAELNLCGLGFRVWGVGFRVQGSNPCFRFRSEAGRDAEVGVQEHQWG